MLAQLASQLPRVLDVYSYAPRMIYAWFLGLAVNWLVNDFRLCHFGFKQIAKPTTVVNNDA